MSKPRNHGKAWESDDLWYAAECWAANKPLVQIAKTLGRTPNACAAKVRQIVWAYRFNGTISTMDFLKEHTK